MKKAILSILALALAAMTLFASCSAAQIKDTNGDEDYTLQTLTEKDLIKSRSSVSKVSVSNTSGGVTVVKIDEISGVSEFKRFRGGSYTITVSYKLSAGNARLALCTSDKVLHEFQPNENDQTYTFDCDGSSVWLKGAFESAKIELVFSAEKTN